LSYVRLDLGLTEEQPGPWIVALHGLGDRPESFLRLFNDAPIVAHIYALQAPIPYADGFDWFGVRVTAPDATLAAAIRSAAGLVEATCEHLAQASRNRGQPLVTGFSQGGYLSFALAALYPGQVKAALPLSGALPRALWPEALQGGVTVNSGLPPVFAFHGEQDAVVPIGPTQQLLPALRKAGFNAQIKAYSGVRHSVSPAERADWFETLRAQLSAERRPN
jgi:phospholipase/carboxylesterase